MWDRKRDKELVGFGLDGAESGTTWVVHSETRVWEEPTKTELGVELTEETSPKETGRSVSPGVGGGGVCGPGRQGPMPSKKERSAPRRVVDLTKRRQ